MAAENENEVTPMKNPTSVERQSERELVVTRTFDGPARIVFKAWTTPELIKRWWMPKSIGIAFISCEIDARTGGSYRFVFAHPETKEPVAFFGKYLEVTPPSRLVWTNEESDQGSITTVTFEEKAGKTLVTLRDLHPSKKALDDTIASGATSGFSESFEQLDEVLVSFGASVGR